jgi:elongation factor Ts
MSKEITPAMIKELRERTGVPVGKCKEALETTQGDMERAIDHLRRTGMAAAVKKGGRETNEGIIKVGDHPKAVALVEVNAETDFVVKNEKFQQFATDLLDEVRRDAPTSVQNFLSQKYSKDPSLTIDEYRANLVQLLGENIQIKRVELFFKKPNSSLGIYSHMGGKLVTLVELIGSDAEEGLAKEIAMHVAAEAPEFLAPEEIPARVIEHEREIARAQIKDKPAQIIEKIVDGKMKAYFDQACLICQPFVKDNSLTVGALVEKRGIETNKPLKLQQFLRWKVGE